MIFKKYTVYENKLSEQVSDDNPLKQKLIDMETPTDKHPVYSFLSIGLLIYVWMFLIALVYNKAYGYQLAIAVVLFTTSCFAITYKKEYLIGINNTYRRNGYIIIAITLLFSIIIPSSNETHTYLKDIIYEFIFFLGINKKSYIAISILAFFSLGLTLSYNKSSYTVFRGLYSENKTYKNKPIEDLISNYFIYSSLGFIALVYLIYLNLNPAEDDFQFKLKKLSMIYYLYFPQILVTYILTNKYYNIYLKNKPQGA